MALQAYRLLARPVVQDLGLVPLVFDLLQIRCSTDEAVALMERLDVIHSEVQTAARLRAGDGPSALPEPRHG